MVAQPTSVRLPKDMKVWLQKLAKREQRTISAQIIVILALYKAHVEKQE